MRPINLIIIHCSATPPTMDIGANEIRKWHTSPDKNDSSKPWSDIGYHYVIRRNGEIDKGREDKTPGAHTSGNNANSLGVCLVGGIDSKGRPSDNFTKSQWGSLERLMRILKVEFPSATIHGHNEFSTKACPSFDVQKWVKDVNV